MYIGFDANGDIEIPNIILCNPYSTFVDGMYSYPTNAIANLSCVEDIEIVSTFNSPSELNFRINAPPEDSDVSLNGYNAYSAIHNKRLLFVYGYGYYVISNVEDGFDGVVSYKDISAKSCEFELSFKTIPYIEERSWVLLTQEDGEDTEVGLLNYIVENIMMWRIGYVSDDVKGLRRYLSNIDVNESILSFMINEMQSAYECIFVFDNTNRVINVYSPDNFISDTDVFLAKDNLIRDMKIVENSDSVITALSITGDNDLPISPVNPLGTNTLYDFSYFYGWMTPSLVEKIQSWVSDIADEMDSTEDDSYHSLNTQLYNKLSLKVNNDAEIDRLTILKNMYERCRLNIISESSMSVVESYNDVIEQNGGNTIDIHGSIEHALAFIMANLVLVQSALSDRMEDREEIDSEIDAINESISGVISSLAISGYFTEEEQVELSAYIYEGKFSNEYIAVNDVMTPVEKIAKMRELYISGARELSKVSRPSTEYDISTEDIVFQPDFPTEWTESLNVGCSVNVRINNEIAKLFLSSITVSFDDASVSFKFSNRIDKYDNKTLFENVLGSVSKSASAISSLNNTVSPIKDGELEYLRSEIDYSKTVGTGGAIASSDGAVVLDKYGLIGRRTSGSGYDSKQLKVSGTSITFTDDSWSTRGITIGELAPQVSGKDFGIDIHTPIFIDGEEVQLLIPEVVTYEEWITMTPEDGKRYYVLAPES